MIDKTVVGLLRKYMYKRERSDYIDYNRKLCKNSRNINRIRYS